MAENVATVSKSADGVDKNTMTITLDGLAVDNLLALVKYAHKDRIALHGIVSVQKEINFLSIEFVKDMVASRHKQLANQLKDRRDKDTSEYFRLLIAKGTPVDQAYKMAYGQ